MIKIKSYEYPYAIMQKFEFINWRGVNSKLLIIKLITHS